MLTAALASLGLSACPNDRDVSSPALSKWRAVSLQARTHSNRRVGAGCLVGHHRHGCGQTADERPFGIPGMLYSLLLTKIELAILSRCAPVIAPSKWQRERLLADGYRKERLWQCRRRFASDRWSSAALRRMDRCRSCLLWHDCSGIKGVSHALRASARVKEPHLLWIAGDGPALPDLRRLASELDVEKRVRFLGGVEPSELESAWDRARLLVVPSLWPETFGMVGPEAMARAIPVVAYGQAGILDWLEAAPTGTSRKGARYWCAPTTLRGWHRRLSMSYAGERRRTMARTPRQLLLRL